MEFVADYAFFQRDLEGNCHERTTHDPQQFFSTKDRSVGVEAKVVSVAADGSSANTSDRDSSTILAEASRSRTRGDDPEKMEPRGRLEAPIDEKSAFETSAFSRTESHRHEAIRGEEFRRMEGVGRGEGGVSDNCV
jgi:hypothetical protein